MLAFSGISLIVSVGSNLLIWQLLGQELSLMRLFCLSFSSLFLFANIQLLLEYKIPMRCSHWVTPIIWGVVGILFVWKQERIAQFLLYVPISIVTAIVIGLLLSFICLLRHNYFIEKEGTITYVSA
jgi:asparagine N-glycosylation enzyme membrane subunit Stt3